MADQSNQYDAVCSAYVANSVATLKSVPQENNAADIAALLTHLHNWNWSEFSEEEKARFAGDTPTLMRIQAGQEARSVLKKQLGTYLGESANTSQFFGTLLLQ